MFRLNMFQPKKVVVYDHSGKVQNWIPRVLPPWVEGDVLKMERGDQTDPSLAFGDGDFLCIVIDGRTPDYPDWVEKAAYVEVLPLTRKLLQAMREVARREYLEVLLMDEEEDRPVGFARGWHNPETGAGFLDRLYLEPEYRGNGFGKMLLERFELLQMHCGATKMELVSEDEAAGFWMEMGYRIADLDLCLRFEKDFLIP